ncbi:thiol:disulfide interchange protein DsbG [Alcanivorax sp. N3-2A]|nr:thiol:disulfide interchange protein DsbG [Alcanivorax sp. N3-2A]|tara:strand:- start:30287 stop:30847 length:561 start_codon:yes stop_codon:yes gene_type:complete
MLKPYFNALLVAALMALPWPAFAAANQDRVLALLENATWVAEGADQPERVVYMFTDMNCPYCARQWQAMQPYLQRDDNVTQVRHILVALLRPTSLPKAAAVLAADDPAATFAQAERHYGQQGAGPEPLETVPAELENQIQGNTILMMRLGLKGTPATLFLDPDGKLQVAPGVLSDDALRRYVFQVE